MRVYGVVGAGGFGREVMPVAKEMLRAHCSDAFRLVFIDDGITDACVNGYEVLTTDAFFALDATQYFFNAAVGNGKTRERIFDALTQRGATPFSIQSLSHTLVMDANEIAEGAVLCPFTTITANARIGRFFQANIYSYVAHDCVIGDFVTFAPGVKCNGNVTIENHAYIGTGAIIKQGTPDRPITIGEGAIVGMGAVVNKSVPAGAVVVGNPAKPLRTITGGQ
jgi:sugar O-acyltransferase (sialic acid O-acetyltransferase NeuD family)